MMPYFAPEAHIPIISWAPRFAAMKARLVIHTGTEWPDVRKSSLVEILRRTIQPIPRTKAKYSARIR